MRVFLRQGAEGDSVRNRILKEGFFRNYDLACLPPLARILFQGLWCMADKEGRLVDQPPRIKADILPYDDCELVPLLDSLHTSGFIVRYEVSGRHYIQVVNFTKHQTLTTYEKNQTASDIPPLSVENALDRPADSDSGTSEELQKNFRSKSERTEQNRTETLRGEKPPSIWDVGVPLLAGDGRLTERSARSLLGRLAKEHTTARVAEALGRTSHANPANPHEYLVAVLTREQKPRNQAEMNGAGKGKLVL